jgi:hypothetical protein
VRDGWAEVESCRSHPARLAATETISTKAYLILIKGSDCSPMVLSGTYIGYNHYQLYQKKHQRERSVWFKIVNPSPARTDQPQSASSKCNASADLPWGRSNNG